MNIISYQKPISFVKRFFGFSFAFLGIIVFLNSCNPKKEKFDVNNWNKSVDGFYLHREFMVDDLTNNYLKVGMTYNEIIKLLGSPGNFSDNPENSLSYELMTDYGWDIDPVETKTLKILISKDSTLLSFEIEHWKK